MGGLFQMFRAINAAPEQGGTVAIAVVAAKITGKTGIDMSPALIIALTIHLEASGEPITGRLAVAAVIQARATATGRPAWQVCLTPGAFACWRYRRPSDYTTPPLQEPGFASALRLARVVVRGGRLAVGDGRVYDHYHADSIAPPAWTNGMEGPYRIGRHLFYRSTGTRQ